EGEPHQINGAVLPWSIEIITTAPSMTGNILAQTRNADGLGCRITANDEKKDERYTNEVSAYVYCFVKSA
ncbi:MmpS family transport accessory protein, partial [Mycobacteroides abscessus]